MLRNGRAVQLTVKVSAPALETLDGAQVDARLKGATFSSQFADTQEEDGVVVSAVVPNSAAASVGLRVYDQLLALNRQPINTIDDLRRIGRPRRTELLLNIRRGDSSFMILVQ